MVLTLLSCSKMFTLSHALPVFLGTCLCIIIALESTTVKWVKGRQTVDPPSEQLVIISEISKTVISYVAYLFVEWKASYRYNLLINDEEFEAIAPTESSRLVDTSTLRGRGVRSSSFGTQNVPVFTDTSSLQSNTISQLRVSTLQRLFSESTVWFLFPALLYTVSNNVTFIALGHLSSAMFALLMNFKIPITGVIAWMTLHKDMTSLQWVSLLIMFFGSLLACLRIENNSIELNCSWMGLGLMVVYSLCSASAGVFMEYLTRFRFREENIFIQNVKFGMYGIITNTIIAISRGTMWHWDIQPIHLLSVLSMVVNGFMTAAVLKFCGSIVKTYSASFAAIVAGILAMMIWKVVLQWNFWVGCVLCSIAINLYAYAGASRIIKVTVPVVETVTNVDLII